MKPPKLFKAAFPLFIVGSGSDSWLADQRGRAIIERTRLDEKDHVEFLKWVMTNANDQFEEQTK